MRHLIKVPMDDSSRVGDARRLIVSMCRQMQFSELEIAQASIIVTEAASNLIKHAKDGELLVRSLECGGVMGLELLSIDCGPGMGNFTQFLQDGFSTAGTPGTGLGAIVRTSTEFDIYSRRDQGTVIMSRYWSGRLLCKLKKHPLEIGTVCLPITDKEPCGDGWAVEQNRRHSVLLACDGLGHGQNAAAVSRKAELIFHDNWERPVPEVVGEIHSSLKGTRGGAVAVMEIDYTNEIVRYCGIGNISARLINAGMERNLVSHNGTIGYEGIKIQEFTSPWYADCIVVMHSDGISSRWHISDYPGIAIRHPSIIAGVLYRDFRRLNDDITVLVAKRRSFYGTFDPQVRDTL